MPFTVHWKFGQLGLADWEWEKETCRDGYPKRMNTEDQDLDKCDVRHLRSQEFLSQLIEWQYCLVFLCSDSFCYGCEQCRPAGMEIEARSSGGKVRWGRSINPWSTMVCDVYVLYSLLLLSILPELHCVDRIRCNIGALKCAVHCNPSLGLHCSAFCRCVSHCIGVRVLCIGLCGSHWVHSKCIEVWPALHCMTWFALECIMSCYAWCVLHFSTKQMHCSDGLDIAVRCRHYNAHVFWDVSLHFSLLFFSIESRKEEVSPSFCLCMMPNRGTY